MIWWMMVIGVVVFVIGAATIECRYEADSIVAAWFWGVAEVVIGIVLFTAGIGVFQ